MSEDYAWKAQLRQKWQITVPKGMRHFLELEKGDYVGFRVDREGQVVVERLQLVSPIHYEEKNK